jgi:hypothetical protein
MQSETTRRPSSECLSDLALDEWLALEAEPELEARHAAHAAGCAYCNARLAQRKAANSAYLASAPQLTRRRMQPPSKRMARPRLWWAGGLAAAASVFLLLTFSARQPDAGARSKGGARLGFYVKSGDAVREGAPGERVRPGDALRFIVPRGERRYLAVLGRDSRGVVSVYFPAGDAAARPSVEPSDRLGQNVALEGSVVLDDAPGSEQLFGVFCDAPVPIDPLRAGLARQDRPSPPAGCVVAETSIVKQVPR